MSVDSPGVYQNLYLAIGVSMVRDDSGMVFWRAGSFIEEGGVIDVPEPPAALGLG
jgi:hypothetical protein